MPGMTLVGFKPRELIKPYHNLRSSYFLYPDEEHIQGSSQFFDALIARLVELRQVGIVKLVPRNNQELRFAALFPQEEKYDEKDHFQTPPGFNMVILPFAEDIVNFVGEKTIVEPQRISTELVEVTKLLVNNLTIHDFDFRDFENPALQKFYSHLQAHALNEKDVVLRPDLLEPDIEGFKKYSDVVDIVKEALMLECQSEGYAGFGEGRENGCTPVKEEESEEVGVRRRGKAKLEPAKVKEEERQPMVKSQGGRSQGMKEEGNGGDLVGMVEELVLEARLKDLKVADMRKYLIMHGMDGKGSKEALIDRVLVFMEHKNSI